MARVLIADSSEVVIGRGVLTAENLLPDRPARTKAAVLTQAPVAQMAERLTAELRASGLAVERRLLPDREAAKTLTVLGEVYDWLADQQLGRTDTVVGVGGGAVTDLAGFVAATWLRGVEVVHVPTTLLGAVDAAIGGKTGINLRGKNLVGAFWSPARVVIDLDVLAALPLALLREGMAEALKAGLVGDVELVHLLEQRGLEADLELVIPAAVRVKAGVVSDDYRELGRRAILNYGHTIGHAVETAAGVPHGDSVAIGMVAAGAISERLAGFTDSNRQRHAIESLGLPTRAPRVDRPRVLELLALDKKSTGTQLRMVLLEAIGRPVVRPVELSDLDAGLEAIGL